MPIGLGILLPILGAILSGVGGLGSLFRGTETIRRSTRPGAQPGTLTPEQAAERFGDVSGSAGRIADSLETGSQFSNLIRDFPEYLGETDRIVSMFEGSPLGTWGQELDDFATDFPEALRGRLAPFEEEARARGEEYRATGEELTGVARQGYETAKGYAEKMAATTPESMQSQMDTIVGNMIGNVNDAMAARARQAEADVARRGLSPEAARAMQESIAGENMRANLQKAADVAGWGTSLASNLQTAGAGLLAGPVDQMLQNEAQIGDIYGKLRNTVLDQSADRALAGESVIGQVVPSATTAAGNLREAYDVNLGNALSQRANALLVPGSILDQINLYNTQALSGADAATANALLNLSMGLFNTGMGGLFSKQIADMQQPKSPFGTAFGAGAGSTLGSLGALWAMSQIPGLSAGSLFGGFGDPTAGFWRAMIP